LFLIFEYNEFMEGISARHGGHQVAQKLIKYILPLFSDSLIKCPSCDLKARSSGMDLFNAKAEEGASALYSPVLISPLIRSVLASAQRNIMPKISTNNILLILDLKNLNNAIISSLLYLCKVASKGIVFCNISHNALCKKGLCVEEYCSRMYSGVSIIFYILELSVI